jgi:flagellin-like protein
LAKRKNLMKSKKALSPVIATVILVAVTITVAIAVAYWMGGIAGLYTRLEKVEITSTQVAINSTINGWTVTMSLKNTGSADAKISDILINGNLVSGLATVTTTPAQVNVNGLPVLAGGTATLKIFIGGTTTGCSSGSTIDLKIHTAAGKEYPQMVTLT